ncbi:unnamed protein product [Protopolystoma xenopodis]|uniref:Uncharacterized protein n=1 Tax=Protopolystoma xenopodis TaxID=117903 RepID=A0A448WBD4_9PLAT|nr:unnamed protein product [Protopolystoma xenopodis]
MQRVLAQTKEAERKMSEQKRDLERRMKADGEELRRFRTETAHREAQFTHDRRRLERELSGLRQRLTQILPHPSLVITRPISSTNRTAQDPVGDINRADKNMGSRKGRLSSSMLSLNCSNFSGKIPPTLNDPSSGRSTAITLVASNEVRRFNRVSNAERRHKDRSVGPPISSASLITSGRVNCLLSASETGIAALHGATGFSGPRNVSHPLVVATSGSLEAEVRK